MPPVLSTFVPMSNTFLVKTFFGLESVLAEEIRELGGQDVKEENRAVSCRGDLELCYRLNKGASNLVHL